MKKRTQVLATPNDLLVNLTLNGFSASLLSEFAEKIIKPFYNGNLNSAVQDLIRKTLAEQEFVHSHITQVNNF